MRSENLLISYCLWLCHETMLCAVCFTLLFNCIHSDVCILISRPRFSSAQLIRLEIGIIYRNIRTTNTREYNGYRFTTQNNILWKHWGQRQNNRHHADEYFSALSWIYFKISLIFFQRVHSIIIIGSDNGLVPNYLKHWCFFLPRICITRPRVKFVKHNAAEAKWPPVCKRHFQIRFSCCIFILIQWNLLICLVQNRWIYHWSENCISTFQEAF